MRRRRLLAIGLCALGLASAPATIQASEFRTLDQGPAWTQPLRDSFYAIDQGSELIPLAWLKALRQRDGRPFLIDALSRYGYLSEGGAAGLPVGFTSVPHAQGPVVGLTCAACHTRDLVVGATTYRVDGGPAFADFQTFVADLDRAARDTLSSTASFDRFAAEVLGASAVQPQAKDVLHAEVTLWSVRFHTLIARSLPVARPWGPGRLDAISMIYNRLAGLDLGPPPTFLLPQNIARADAPARYPFLWNAGRQDLTQWTGFAQNGNDFLALARNLGQLYGVFGRFHPQPADGFDPLGIDYLSDNSANLAGLGGAEALLSRLAPPKWPFAVDRDLAARGKAVFDRAPEAGGCAACHGDQPGAPRPPTMMTLKTPVLPVGTDARAWQVAFRTVDTGSLAGASIPDAVPSLGSHDLALRLLKVAVLGPLVEREALAAASQQGAGAASRKPPTMMNGMSIAPMAQMKGVMSVTPEGGPAPVPGAYEARVLHGIWAAAPYLHNGSVPTLADLLEPPTGRPQSFAVGPNYDPVRVGLARGQNAGQFILRTTGCEDRMSGDSRCGHDYGTRLSPEDKKALLEYLKLL